MVNPREPTMATHKYIDLNYEQVAGLVEAELLGFKLTLSDFGGKLKIPQNREKLEVGIAQLLSATSGAATPDPQIAQLEEQVKALKRQLSDKAQEVETAKQAPPINKNQFPKGEPHGTFDNSDSGFREVWKLGTKDVKWPKAMIERRLVGTTSKPWGYYPKFPKV